MMSGWLFRKRRPTVRNPIAASGRLSVAQRQLIRRQLLDDELVVGQIVIEGANDLVAISVGVGITASSVKT